MDLAHGFGSWMHAEMSVLKLLSLFTVAQAEDV